MLGWLLMLDPVLVWLIINTGFQLSVLFYFWSTFLVRKIPYKTLVVRYWPIIKRDTVRCSRPEAFMAPRTVPTTAQQIPTNAIITMNHLMLTVWDTEIPQHVFDVSGCWWGWWGWWGCSPVATMVWPGTVSGSLLLCCCVLQKLKIFFSFCLEIFMLVQVIWVISLLYYQRRWFELF